MLYEISLHVNEQKSLQVENDHIVNKGFLYVKCHSTWLETEYLLGFFEAFERHLDFVLLCDCERKETCLNMNTIDEEKYQYCWLTLKRMQALLTSMPASSPDERSTNSCHFILYGT